MQFVSQISRTLILHSFNCKSASSPSSFYVILSTLMHGFDGFSERPPVHISHPRVTVDVAYSGVEADFFWPDGCPP